MARDFNQNRNTNAHLGEVSITRYGKTWAIQYGFDGANIINNEVLPVPTDIKEYLEGNDNITIFACASNIDKLCEYALASFPSIEDLYLFKTNAIVILEDDLSYLLDLNKIYVPSDLLSAYISAYTTLSSKFDTIVEDYTLTIPFIGDTTLTSEYVDSVIAMLSNAEKNVITKVVIPTDFSSSSATAIAWGYDFSDIVNLDNNIWYGTTKYDFSVWTIEGSGILTSEIVESSIDSIPSNKLSGITKIVVALAFTSFQNRCFNIIPNYLPQTLDLSLSTFYFEFYKALKPYWGAEAECLYTDLNVRDVINYRTSVNIQYYNDNNIRYLYLPNATNYGSYIYKNFKKVFVPKATIRTGAYENGPYKNFFGTSNCSYNNITSTRPREKDYFTATSLVNYKNGTNGTTWVSSDLINRLIGVIDGNNVYQNIGIGNETLSMNYPKLTGIDTEASIQLLTPSDNALYLASDTGDLWQYSNGGWTNLFSGYTPTWYSNEDCTTTIQPSDITIDMTVYVKLS